MKAKILVTIRPWNGWIAGNPNASQPSPIEKEIEVQQGDKISNNLLGDGFIMTGYVEVKEVSLDQVTLYAYGHEVLTEEIPNKGKQSWEKTADANEILSILVLQKGQTCGVRTRSRDAGTSFLFTLIEITE